MSQAIYPYEANTYAKAAVGYDTVCGWDGAGGLNG